MHIDSFRTENQIKFEKAFLHATREHCVVAVIDHSGTGFKYALNRFKFYHSDVRVAAVKISKGVKNREIGIDLMKGIMTIRFSNFKYNKVSIVDLIRVLGNRVRRDLLGKKILIVIEGVHNLREVKLIEFFRAIRGINFPCGVVLRIHNSYLIKVKKWGDDAYKELEKFTELRQITTENSTEDIAKLCHLHGLSNGLIVNEICHKTTSFSTAMMYVKRCKDYKIMNLQLDLFTPNRIRF
ncbi:MAG TPA: hypothetical protein PK185_11885 [Cyclobacteriaceae bacterium]|nr:hypothetical protein [Cyclobacteriaceae bacterium]